MHLLLRKSQTLIVLSSLAEIIYLPPGWKTIPLTQLSWPDNVKRHCPEPTSQIYNLQKKNEFQQKKWKKKKLTQIVLSLDPEARNGPWCAPFLLSPPAASLIAELASSGAHAIHSTVWSCSRSSAYTQKRNCLKFRSKTKKKPLIYFAILGICLPYPNCMIIWTWCHQWSIKVDSHHSNPFSMSVVCFNAISIK